MRLLKIMWFISMAFGAALRASVNSNADRFDRVQILKDTHDPLVAATRGVLRAFMAKDN